MVRFFALFLATEGQGRCGCSPQGAMGDPGLPGGIEWRGGGGLSTSCLERDGEGDKRPRGSACPNLYQRNHGRRHDSNMLHVFVVWWPIAMCVTMWRGFAGGCQVACASFNAVRGTGSHFSQWARSENSAANVQATSSMTTCKINDARCCWTACVSPQCPMQATKKAW